MSAYVGKFLTAVSSALEFNTATLSGAIDIVVIEDDTGRRHCSPFHVRFGKLQLLKSRGIPVEIELNGQRTNLRMLLGAAGEAYFYNPQFAAALHEPLTPLSEPSSSVDAAVLSKRPSAPQDLSVPTRAATQPLPEAHPSFDKAPSASGDALFKPASSPRADEALFAESPATIAKNARHPFASGRFENAAALPFPTPVSETCASDYPFGYISDSEVELTRIERDGTAEVVDEPRSPPLYPSQRKWTSAMARNVTAMHPPEFVLPTDGDDDLRGASEKSMVQSTDMSDDQTSALFDLPASSPSTPVQAKPGLLAPNVYETGADSPERHDERGVDDMPRRGMDSAKALEANHSKLKDIQDPLTVIDSISDVVGEEDGKLECRSIDGYDADEDPIEGLRNQVADVLSRQNSDSSTHGAVPHFQKAIGGDSVTSDAPPFEPEASATIKDSRQLMASTSEPAIAHRSSEKESDPSSERRRTDASGRGGVLAMSLCGGLLGRDMGEDQMMELFERHQVTQADFASNPNILGDPALLFRVDDRLVEYRVAAPFIFSILAFNERLDIDKLARQTSSESKVDTPKSPRTSSRRFGWFGWASPSVVGEPLLQEEDIEVLEAKEEIIHVAAKDAIEEVSHEPVKDAEESEVATILDKPSQAEIPAGLHPESETSSVARGQNIDKEQDVAAEEKTAETTDPAPENAKIPEPSVAESISFSELDPDALSLRPTSEELDQLDLKPGANTIRFVVQSSAVELNCRIFLWGCHSKIVISDVDGTITRSDVLGHILPAVGRDWSQVGVAGLYTQIEKNGYKLLYLTARPIGQASQTRAFLHNVTQGSARLPNGPVLMSPNRLVESFTREVIRRKPHEFKIAALRDIRFLFSPDYNPFHAGFGNRDTDIISYRAVGLIPQRIFVVNPKGELVVMKAKYESTASYSSLQDLVESVFPDISGKGGLEKIQALTESATYNDWNYWRGTLPNVDLDALLASV